MSASLNIEASVAWISLQRPGQMNALDLETLEALRQHLDRVATSADVRVVVLTGSGSAFCAGVDLKAVSALASSDEGDFLDRVAEVFDRLRNMAKPVIAAVNGIAVAGGFELAISCDLIVAAESARLGDAHANYGILPGAGGAAILPRRLPMNVAKQLLFTGDTLTAAQLAGFGLVNQVVADDKLTETVQELAATIAARSPLVLAGMKRVANATTEQSQAESLQQELRELRAHMNTSDFAAGLAAFVGKRSPVFEG